MAPKHLVLGLDARGPAHAERTLQTYLPGFSLGLVALSPRQMLLPAMTARALALQYGRAQVAAILAAAGAPTSRAVDESEAIALLRQRDTSKLPPRAAAPAPAAAGVDRHLELIRAPQAWARLGGAGQIDWTGVSVGHIDTGYASHPCFGFPNAPWVDVALGRTFFAPSPVNSVPGPGGGVDPLQFQMDGHGTRTASTVCGHAPGAPGGPFFGAAPCVPLVPVRIADVVLISHAQSEFAAAVNHLVEVARVGVISLSMGIWPYVLQKDLRRAINKAYDAGVIMVCAAGNRVNTVVAPARLHRTLAVAGVDLNLRPWGGSSYGAQVDLSAPADDVRRAEFDDKGGAPRYRGGGDGTSYATALTAGAAALWLAQHRAALGGRYPQPWQRVEAFKTAVCASAQVPPGWQPGSFGSGVLDIDALLQFPLPPPAPAPDAAA